MKNFAFDHPRLVAATPALDPAIRRAAWPAGVTEDQLRRFERDVGIGSPKSAPLAEVKPAVEAKPAPTAPAPISTSPASASRPAAPVAPPAKAKADNPLMEAASRAAAAFNSAHKEDFDA